METVDAFRAGFGWIQDELLQRCSHALVADDEVWLVDPVDGRGVSERIRAAGKPAGVIQLLDRHKRDCAVLASRLGVAHHVVPREPLGRFEFISLRRWRRWDEVALWWPSERVLVCADVLGTAGYFRLGRGKLGLHPLFRLRRPRQLARLAPEVILCGHGRGIVGDATAALRRAV